MRWVQAWAVLKVLRGVWRLLPEGKRDTLRAKRLQRRRLMFSKTPQGTGDISMGPAAMRWDLREPRGLLPGWKRASNGTKSPHFGFRTGVQTTQPPQGAATTSNCDRSEKPDAGRTPEATSRCLPPAKPSPREESCWTAEPGTRRSPATRDLVRGAALKHHLLGRAVPPGEQSAFVGDGSVASSSPPVLSIFF